MKKLAIVSVISAIIMLTGFLTTLFVFDATYSVNDTSDIPQLSLDEARLCNLTSHSLLLENPPVGEARSVVVRHGFPFVVESRQIVQSRCDGAKTQSILYTWQFVANYLVLTSPLLLIVYLIKRFKKK